MVRNIRFGMVHPNVLKNAKVDQKISRICIRDGY